MKQRPVRKQQAFNRIELIVVILIPLFFFAMAAFLIPRFGKASTWSAVGDRISCVNNLKEIGTAYRLWAGDNGDRTPAEQTVANGGWGDLLTNADQGAICWTNYVIMSNELGQSPELVLCPADERHAAADFGGDFKDNTHVSYFVGVSANDSHPQSIQGGDRNLSLGSKPGPDYGLSPKSGKGNDVAIPTNSLSSPVSWALKMHSGGKRTGAGNILLGDGSVQQASSAAFNQTWLRNAAPTTNWPAGHLPASPSIRLIFP